MVNASVSYVMPYGSANMVRSYDKKLQEQSILFNFR